MATLLGEIQSQVTNRTTLNQIYLHTKPSSIFPGIAYTGSNGYNFTTLSYSTGPGFWTNINNQTNDISRPWMDTETLNIHDKNYRQVAHTPTRIARHGGEDVAVYAQGNRLGTVNPLSNRPNRA